MLFVLALVVAAVAALRGIWSPCGLSMLSSLNPVAEAARGHRFWITALWYVAGAAFGGAVLGLGLTAAALGFAQIGANSVGVWVAVLVVGAIAVASDLELFGRSLPVHPRQVDERWLTTYRRWIYASGFGVQIGAGFATYIMSAAVYLTAALAILTGSTGQAFAVALTFGVVRGLAVGVAAFARTPEALRVVLGRIDAAGGWSARAATAICAVAVLVAATALGGPIGLAGAAVAIGLIAVAARRGSRASDQRGLAGATLRDAVGTVG